MLRGTDSASAGSYPKGILGRRATMYQTVMAYNLNGMLSLPIAVGHDSNSRFFPLEELAEDFVHGQFGRIRRGQALLATLVAAWAMRVWTVYLYALWLFGSSNVVLPNATVAIFCDYSVLAQVPQGTANQFIISDIKTQATWHCHHGGASQFDCCYDVPGIC